jgi:hypothetical protein
MRFVPVAAHRTDQAGPGSLIDWLDYYSDDKVMFRFTRPSR